MSSLDENDNPCSIKRVSLNNNGSVDAGNLDHELILSAGDRIGGGAGIDDEDEFQDDDDIDKSTREERAIQNRGGYGLSARALRSRLQKSFQHLISRT